MEITHNANSTRFHAAHNWNEENYGRAMSLDIHVNMIRPELSYAAAYALDENEEWALVVRTDDTPIDTELMTKEALQVLAETFMEYAEDLLD